MAVEQGDSALLGGADATGAASGRPAETNMVDEKKVSARIAVAEDEPDIRKTFVRLLELMGHQVIYSVSNGAELLEQSLDGQVDLVFVDLDMPVMDGLAAAEEVERQGIPVILVSGHPDSESVVIDHEPVVARITKPATPAVVQEAIVQALAGHRAKPR
jgi:two-component system, response regulator PdtaR